MFGLMGGGSRGRLGETPSKVEDDSASVAGSEKVVGGLRGWIYSDRREGIVAGIPGAEPIGRDC